MQILVRGCGGKGKAKQPEIYLGHVIRHLIRTLISLYSWGHAGSK